MSSQTTSINLRMELIGFCDKTEKESLRLMDTDKDRELVRICLDVIRLAASQIPVSPPTLRVVS